LRKRLALSSAGLVVVLAAVLFVSTVASASSRASSDTFSVASLEPNSLIPGKSTDGELALAALFTPLVGMDSKGHLRYLQARSVVGSDHAKTWSITIRKGWTFHNGEPVTAQSYVDAWNYNAYGPHAFATSGQLSNIVGYAALNPTKGTPSTTQLSGLKVLSRYVFRVRLAAPDSQFPYELTANQWGFYPLPKSAYADLNAYNEKPIGDGPYQMSRPWQHDQSISMTAYPRYAGPDKPKTKNLVFKIFSSVDTAYTDVQAGNTDMAGVPGDKLSQFKKDFHGRYFSRGGQNIEYLGFPLFAKPWQNQKLREAISLAIDRKAINKALFGGAYLPADSFLPATTPGGNPHSCRYCRFDPVAAKRLLQEAGGFEGTMVVNYLGGWGIDQEYQAIANQLRQNLGIKVTAQPSVTISAYYTNIAKKNYRSGPIYDSASAPYPSARALITQNLLPPSSFQAGTYYANAAAERLISAGDRASTPAAAIRAYQQAEARIQADFPTIPLFFLPSPMVYSSRIGNVKADALTNPIYTAVSVKG
jgi:peptide/nickel transport system substrate-binding protein/oligopeptide transport system substrate-binding protein